MTEADLAVTLFRWALPVVSVLLALAALALHLRKVSLPDRIADDAAKLRAELRQVDYSLAALEEAFQSHLKKAANEASQLARRAAKEQTPEPADDTGEVSPAAAPVQPWDRAAIRRRIPPHPGWSRGGGNGTGLGVEG